MPRSVRNGPAPPLPLPIICTHAEKKERKNRAPQTYPSLPLPVAVRSGMHAMHYFDRRQHVQMDGRESPFSYVEKRSSFLYISLYKIWMHGCLFHHQNEENMPFLPNFALFINCVPPCLCTTCTNKVLNTSFGSQSGSFSTLVLHMSESHQRLLLHVSLSLMIIVW